VIGHDATIMAVFAPQGNRAGDRFVAVCEGDDFGHGREREQESDIWTRMPLGQSACWH
jgi:hypothetical protein